MPCIAKAFAWMGEHWEGVTALAAVVVAVYEVHATRAHNKLSVLPHLDTFTFRDETHGTITFNVKNHGLGPARIVSVKVYLDGDIVTSSSANKTHSCLSSACNKVIAGIPVTHTQIIGMENGTVISTGMELEIFRWTYTASPTVTHVQMQAHLERIDLVIEYESFYHQIMTPLDTRKERGKPV